MDSGFRILFETPGEKFLSPKDIISGKYNTSINNIRFCHEPFRVRSRKVTAFVLNLMTSGKIDKEGVNIPRYNLARVFLWQSAFIFATVFLLKKN